MTHDDPRSSDLPLSVAGDAESQAARLDFALKIRKAMIDALPSAIALLDAGGRVAVLNAAWTHWVGAYGLSPGTPYVAGCRRLGLFSAADAQLIVKGVAQVIEGESDLFAIDIVCGGPAHDRLHNVMVLPLDRNAFDGVVAIHTDVTERRQMHDDLVAQTNQLSAVNEELRQFARIASHDLKEPLRSIVSFLQLLSRRYKGQLDADADQFIDFAIKGALRMDAQLNDLMTYIRTTQDTPHLIAVDLNAEVQGVVDELDPLITGTNCRISFDRLPVVVVDRVQIASLFRNLISNALKYRSPHRPPEIAISTRFDEGMVEITVADNGIGIESEYYEDVFLMFRRLFPQSVPEGSGVGLAIVRKVVEHHGGRIWLDSVPGEGTRIHFTLPSGRE